MTQYALFASNSSSKNGKTKRTVAFGNLPQSVIAAIKTYDNRNHQEIIARWLRDPKSFVEQENAIISLDAFRESDREGNTILHLAAIGQKLNLVRYLLGHSKETVNVINSQRNNPLLCAIISAGECLRTGDHQLHNKSIEIIQLLLQHSSATKIDDFYGDTKSAMCIAACYGDLKVVQLLHEEFQVDINESDTQTPLKWALTKEQKNIPLINYLKQNGAVAELTPENDSSCRIESR